MSTATNEYSQEDIAFAERYAENYAIFNAMTIYRFTLLQAPVSRQELPYLNKLIQVVDGLIDESSRILRETPNSHEAS